MMERFFTFIQTYRSGIFFLLLILAIIAALMQWFAWVFALGRFKTSGIGPGPGTGTGSGTSRAELRYIFSEATVKIINDFRHLLALIIVLIFAFALGYSLIKASLLSVGTGTPSVIDNMKEALQAVVATLGGLVGSIIGYYFGESSVVKPAEPRSPEGGATNAPEVQKPPAGGGASEEAEKKAPAPPVPPRAGGNT